MTTDTDWFIVRVVESKLILKLNDVATYAILKLAVVNVGYNTVPT